MHEPETAPGKTVVFIHGAWMVPASWDPFKGRFEAAGYKALAPSWPYMDRPIADLRQRPAKAFGSLTLGAIADHYQRIITALAAPPLIVGHSLAG